MHASSVFLRLTLRMLTLRMMTARRRRKGARTYVRLEEFRSKPCLFLLCLKKIWGVEMLWSAKIFVIFDHFDLFEIHVPNSRKWVLDHCVNLENSRKKLQRRKNTDFGNFGDASYPLMSGSSNVLFLLIWLQNLEKMPIFGFPKTQILSWKP